MARFYAVHSALEAVRVCDEGSIRTLDGVTLRFKPGDWLVTFPSGAINAVEDRVFRELYVPADEEAARLLGGVIR